MFAIRRSLTSRLAVASRAPTRYLSSGSDSITYSGGQAVEGQGGYYGSGGARSQQPTLESNDETRFKMLALAKDVETIRTVMQQVDELSIELESETDTLSSRSIELKNGIKKLLTNPTVEHSLNNLEIQGSPVWGLSTQEREMIMFAREKRNEC